MGKATTVVPWHGNLASTVRGTRAITKEGCNGDSGHFPDQPNQESHLQTSMLLINNVLIDFLVHTGVIIKKKLVIPSLSVQGVIQSVGTSFLRWCVKVMM